MKILKSSFNLVLLALLIASITTSVEAQQDKSKRPSPPKILEVEFGNINLKIDYSAPSVKDREVWGALVPYNKIWRTGANEATTIEVNSDILLQDKNLKAGKYSIFTIPGEEKWTFIFNSDADQWGAYGYDASKDVLRIEVSSKSTKEFAEMLTFEWKENENEGMINLWWENLKVGFSIVESTAK